MASTPNDQHTTRAIILIELVIALAAAGASSASPSSSGRSHATAVPPAAAAGRRATRVPSRYASMDTAVPKVLFRLLLTLNLSPVYSKGLHAACIILQMMLSFCSLIAHLGARATCRFVICGAVVMQGFLQPHRPAAEGAAPQTAAAEPAPGAAPQTSGWQRLHKPVGADAAAAPHSTASPPEPAAAGSADEGSPRSVHGKPSDDEVVSPPDPAAPSRAVPPSQPPVPVLQRLSAGCASSATPVPDEQHPAPAASVAQPQQAAGAALEEAAGTQPAAVVATSPSAAQLPPPPPAAVRRSASGRSEASNEVPPQPAGEPTVSSCPEGLVPQNPVRSLAIRC